MPFVPFVAGNYLYSEDPRGSRMTLVYGAIAWLAGIALGKALHPPWQALLLLSLIHI